MRDGADLWAQRDYFRQIAKIIFLPVTNRSWKNKMRFDF